MPNDKEILDQAFRDAMAAEFKDIPTDDSQIDYTFSEQFESQMSGLCKKEKGRFWRITNTVGKRVAVILVLVLLLFSVAFSVEAIREPIVSFFVRRMDGYTAHRYEGPYKETIEREYTLGWLPDGFELESKRDSVIAVYTSFVNQSGESIVLRQCAGSDIEILLDSEHDQYRTGVKDGLAISLYDDGINHAAIWALDGYVFQLTCYADVSQETILDIIGNVQ